MDWKFFEEDVKELTRAFGYDAQTTELNGDYGVDVLARRGTATVVIQCKLYGKAKVGVDAILKLIGTREHFLAKHAICITTGRFTARALEVADKNHILTVDRLKLIQLCQERNIILKSITVVVRMMGDWFDEIIEVGNKRLLIGRAPHASFRVTSQQVSRAHAQLWVQGQKLYLEDLQSTNGTYVNGRRISGRCTLDYDDVITIGDARFRVAIVTSDGVIPPVYELI